MASQLDGPDHGLGPTGVLVDSDFKAVTKSWRQTAYKWCQSQSFFGDLIFVRLCLAPQLDMMVQQLKVSSSDWDRKQMVQEIQTGHRSYRVVWAYQAEPAKQALCDLAEMLTEDFADVLPNNMLSQEHAALLFRMLNR